MKGPKLWLILGASAVAVGFQNYVFFSNLEGARSVLPGEFDEEFEDEDEADEEAMQPLDGVELATWIETLPTPGRSPFLTREEAMALGGPVSTALPRVAGTLWSPDRREAWIGGHPHSEGDWVGDHWIEAIEPSVVVLRQGERRLRIRADSATRSETADPRETGEEPTDDE